MILLAFIGMSLAWSFSWFAMKLQAASFLPLELSVFYRFFLSSILMFVLCYITKNRLVITKKELPYFIFIGLSNFFLNFLIGYHAVNYIASGVIATMFSLSIIISEIFSSFIDSRKIEKKIVISSIVGFGGLAFFILPLIKFQENTQGHQTIIGIVLTFLMIIIYSLGTILVAKNRQKNSTPLYTSIAYGSSFGAFYLLLLNLFRGNHFNFDFSWQYVSSLAYLVVVATVLAFICLYYLIQTIGSAKANYTALVYPVIALLTSTFFEDFSLNFYNAIGFVLIISALAIEFMSFSSFFLHKIKKMI